ncbi:MAG TPA: MgtC/SapB family protein [Feifaniaceae bacterium]|nr:MgtC/SapB family protein [Feifaniaceae bacterium]
MAELSIVEIVIRLVLAIVCSGFIGFDRQFKHRPAGLRTHILVCVGATLVALIQKQIEAEALTLAIASPELAEVIRADPARLIAQVVSGIGFLGAGTIIVTKRSIMGLTTAASLWAVAGLGLAIGMGYYAITVAGFCAIIVVLTLLKKVVHIPVLKRLEIQQDAPKETEAFISGYFKEKNIRVRDIDHDANFSNGKSTYTHLYTIEIPKGMDYSDIIEDLSKCKGIERIRAINI